MNFATAVNASLINAITSHCGVAADVATEILKDARAVALSLGMDVADTLRNLTFIA